MKKIVSKIALVACSGFATMLAGCPGDTGGEDAGPGETACTTNDDCAEGEVCNGATEVCEEPCDPAATDACGADDACYGNDVAGDNVCQPACDGDADCGAGRTCNLTTGQCLSGCDDNTAPLYLVCAAPTAQCDVSTGECVECLANADCTAPEICDLNSGTCQAPTLCDAPGTLGDDPCAATELCMPDGTCQTPCDDDACAANGNLCDPGLASATYNTCIDADLVRTDCTAAGAHTSDPDAPTLISVGNGQTIADPAANCGAPNTVVEYEARFYSADALDASGAGFYNDICFMTNGTGCVNNQGNTYFETTYTATGNLYILTFQLCQVGTDPAEFAVYVRDTDTDESNASCFDKFL